MDLGNPFETIVDYLQIGGMTCFGYQDRFPIVSALVCIVTHWIRPMVTHNIGY